MIVVDASVVVALLTGHSSTDAIAEQLNRDTDVIAPAHLDAEVLSALRGRMLGRHLTMGDLRTAVARLAAAPIRRITMESPRLLLETVRWFHNLSAYDACYAALAKEFDALLLTGDKGLADSATRAQIACAHVDCSA
ncbi:MULTISPECIES: type II toxin-antitoxin system VapC family toxin [Glycomyces]|uniref:Nucleic acid-binding protein n=2 Tax=Glycomyces TaxID=58113 RepID=A0A9X3SXP7_9ACTN|nr:type II toxin-antitoxin system VapC family toxin [Glycomyces lechevalierae]MDA1385381.1 type II toxin-antitoxin system VapC family toxin [Glycomyces lechevalierae]MDR7337002.1 putative nucleic acid-binding protein [Glycomyces lechevalierae]